MATPTTTHQDATAQPSGANQQTIPRILCSSKNRRGKRCLATVLPNMDKCFHRHVNVPEEQSLPTISHRQLDQLTKSVRAMSKILDQIKAAMDNDGMVRGEREGEDEVEGGMAGEEKEDDEGEDGMVREEREEEDESGDGMAGGEGEGGEDEDEEANVVD
jgi:hypothetical protein